MLLAGRENLYKTVGCVARKMLSQIVLYGYNCYVMSHEGYLYRFDRRSADDGKFCIEVFSRWMPRPY